MVQAFQCFPFQNDSFSSCFFNSHNVNGVAFFLSRSMSAAWRRANLLSALAARQEISPASTWKTPPLTFLCVETRIEGNRMESYINTISYPNETWKDFIICCETGKSRRLFSVSAAFKHKDEHEWK